MKTYTKPKMELVTFTTEVITDILGDKYGENLDDL